MLDCDSDSAAALIKKLNLYKLRAAVTIAQTDLTMHALWQADGLPCPPQAGFYEDPRAEGLGLRGFFETAPDTKLPVKPLDDWHMNRLKLGVTQGTLAMPPGTAFPVEYCTAAPHAHDFPSGRLICP